MSEKSSRNSVREHRKMIGRLSRVIPAIAVFTGAFLLFVSEPLIGRLLLPFWGGAVHVWLICLMFFQGMLLLGYLYAHFLAPKNGILASFPVDLAFDQSAFQPRYGTKPPDPNPLPALHSSGRFALPFTILSTTAIVVQYWLSRSPLGQSHEPYPLYAASNAGSLIGLFGYAFAIEPLVPASRHRVLPGECVMFSSSFLCL